MEKESFEDDEVADYLNAHFVAVKVDKEERPDIDAVYMGVCQALTGSGGWPLTVLLTQEQKPFFAGTYFPKHRRYGQPGVLELLGAVKEKWDTQREKLLASSEEITKTVSRAEGPRTGPRDVDRKPVEQAARQLARSYDRRYGGFGPPPKFPMPHNLLFLLRCHHLGVGGDGLGMVEHTLTQMIRGGIHDHIGGGFSRYSTDEKWLAPHFEKMLYDNALLTVALLECWQLTENPLYKAVAKKTLRYIRREMTGGGGGFYSAQDADIDGEEGKFYTFTPEEITEVLGPGDGRRVCRRYGVTPAGNFEGKSIPNLIGREPLCVDDPELEQSIAALYQYRRSRYKLHTDDKILTSWNALMIVAYAKAYRVLGEGQYLQSAVGAHAFIREHLTDSTGNLLISWRNGKAKGRGLLDDHAFLAWACLELYESTFAIEYLEHACGLMDSVLERFTHEDGGFFLAPKDGEPLIFRSKEQYDGATPSGNSVAAWCLARLSALTGEAKWSRAARGQLAFYADMFHRQPTAYTFALTALMQEVYPAQELICVVGEESAGAGLALELGALYHPQTAILVKTETGAERLSRIAPFTREYGVPKGRAAAYYLCQNQSCSAPVFDLAAAKRMLSPKQGG